MQESPDSVLDPVAKDQRSFGFHDCFALWSSLGVGLLVLSAGALLVPSLSFGMACLAIVLGSAVGAALLALVGVIGSDTGLPTMALLRPALGIRGAIAPTIANLIQLIGWGAFEIIVMSEATDAIARSAGLDLPASIWTVLWGVLVTAMAWGGPLTIVRRFLRTWGIWLVTGSALWLSYQAFQLTSLAELFAHQATGELGFGTALDLVIAMQLSWLPLIADYTRYSKGARSTFWGSGLGNFAANVWFYGLGVVFTLSLVGQQVLPTILGAAGGALALSLILVDESDNAFADIYSAAVSAGHLSSRISLKMLALAFGLICTGVALVVPMARYEGFLLLLGSIFAPLFGIVLVDHFGLRQRQLDVIELDRVNGRYWYQAGLNWRGLVAWILGIGLFHGLNAWYPTFGATIPSLVSAGLIYWGLGKIGLFTKQSALQRAA
ncbi:MAG: putative hydroxymethylpyrimidine transporter CytX [Chloroflexi bacterium]|nr:putative hydroxymethylpyrimidine transporter CytX [Chloroflexota bacterium]